MRIQKYIKFKNILLNYYTTILLWNIQSSALMMIIIQSEVLVKDQSASSAKSHKNMI